MLIGVPKEIKNHEYRVGLTPEERAMLRPDQILYTYLHLAPDPEQTRDLIKSGAVCIAYETVTDAQGDLPLLKPMSQVAGRLAIQVGAKALQKESGGRGVLLGGDDLGAEQSGHGAFVLSFWRAGQSRTFNPKRLIGNC